jgi:PH domain
MPVILREIELRFLKNPGFLKPGRYILREGKLWKMRRDGVSKPQQRTLFLFNDILAYATQPSFVKVLTLNGKLDINHNFFVRKLPSTDGYFRFLVCCSAKSMVFVADDEKHRESWIKSLNWCKTQYLKNNPGPHRRAPVAPLPLWLDLSLIANYEEIFPKASAPQPIGAGVTSSARTRQQIEDSKTTVWQPPGAAIGEADDGATGTTNAAPTTTTTTVTATSYTSRPPPAIPTPVPAPAPTALSHTRRRSSSARSLHTETQSVGGPKFCPMCGAKRAGDVSVFRFCDQCGHKFES